MAFFQGRDLGDQSIRSHYVAGWRRRLIMDKGEVHIKNRISNSDLIGKRSPNSERLRLLVLQVLISGYNSKEGYQQ